MQNRTTTSYLQYAIPILAYCCSSICMTVVNKVVLSAYKFKMNFLLLMFQSLIPVLLLELFTKLRLIPKHRQFKWEEGIRWFPISCGLVVMIYTGSKAVQYLPIPLYTIFKNITIILIAYGERLWFGGSRVSRPMFISFMLMILSSVVGGWADIKSSSLVKDKEVGIFRSYFWMFLNCFCCAAYTLFLRTQLKKFNFKDFDTVYYNNLISIPILIVCSLFAEHKYFGEYKEYYFPSDEDLYETRHSEFVGLCVGILISSIAAFAISYCSSWCIRVTSSTTYSMVGALNKLPISIAGMIFFDDPVTLGGVCGVLIAFGSGILFSYAKTHLNKKEQKSVLPLTTIKDDKEYKSLNNDKY